MDVGFFLEWLLRPKPEAETVVLAEPTRRRLYRIELYRVHGQTVLVDTSLQSVLKSQRMEVTPFTESYDQFSRGHFSAPRLSSFKSVLLRITLIPYASIQTQPQPISTGV